MHINKHNIHGFAYDGRLQTVQNTPDENDFDFSAFDLSSPTAAGEGIPHPLLELVADQAFDLWDILSMIKVVGENISLVTSTESYFKTQNTAFEPANVEKCWRKS